MLQTGRRAHILSGSDTIQTMVYDFLIDPKRARLSDISSKIDESLRESVERDRSSSDSDSDEDFDRELAELDYRVGPSGARRELPVRQWIYDQTQRLSDHAGRFGRLLQRFVSREHPYPTVILGDAHCPVDIEHPLYRRYLTADRATASPPEPFIVLVTPNSAASNFALGYASFVRALTGAAPNMPANYPSHLHYTIRSKRSGFRVHSTPLYWMSPTVFGGKPTSPVSAYLTPGLYRFGGDHPSHSNRIIWDLGQHRVSPTNKSTSVTVF